MRRAGHAVPGADAPHARPPQGKEILANEIGVVFNHNGRSKTPVAAVRGHVAAPGEAIDPELVALEGSVEGGVFHFKAGHYEWLLDIGESLGVGFHAMGTRRHGCSSTLHFCDALKALYGSPDPETALAASFAVENWAAAGFWDELVTGWKAFNAKRPRGQRVPVGFWTHHAALEAQHAGHTMDELREVYCAGRVTDEDGFLDHCDEILDAIGVFWDGLDARRRGVPVPKPSMDYLAMAHATLPGGAEPPLGGGA